MTLCLCGKNLSRGIEDCYLAFNATYCNESRLLGVVKRSNGYLFLPPLIRHFPNEFEFHRVVNMQQTLECRDYKSYITIVEDLSYRAVVSEGIVYLD